MKLRIASIFSALAVMGSLFVVSPAEARSTQGHEPSETAIDAVGFIVKYEPYVSQIAPNGEPTGENYAGVDLENARDLGGGFKAVDFGSDLTPEQAAAALQRLELDPRFQSVSLNRIFQTANYVAKPIMSSILPKPTPLDLPIVIRTAVRIAAAPETVAADAWQSPNTVAVNLSWSKPTNRISGKIAGYKIQIYAGGIWRTLKSRTASTTRSYTTSNTYLKAGTRSKFRVAAVSYYYGRYYTGTYRTIYATPTSIPRANTRILVENSTNEVRFSWAPLVSQLDMGGLQVGYELQVSRGGSSETCSTQTLTTCVISPAIEGAQYTARLVISNDRGSATVGPISVTFSTAIPVTANDSYFVQKQWHLKSGVSNPYGMKVTDAWLSESGSPNVYVAVLDTGITQHPDLDANVVAGYDLVSGAPMPRDATHPNSWTSYVSANDGDGWDSDPSDPGDGSGSTRSSWHGTHVAGIIAAVDNSVGVLGVAPNVKIIPVRVLGVDGGTEGDIVAGLNWAAGLPVGDLPLNLNKANVINMSIGGQGSCPTGSATQSALANIKTHGITVVTAAGNDGSYAVNSYPGNCYPTINVGATGKTGKPAFYSNFGAAVDISAPGGDYCFQVGDEQPDGQIYSTLNAGNPNDGYLSPGNPNYGYELGTSMAAPAVAGVAALLYSKILRKTPTVNRDSNLVDRVVRAILDHTTPLVATIPGAKPSTAILGDPNYRKCVAFTGNSQSYGAGIVNAYAALLAIP